VAPVLPQIFSNRRICTWHELSLRFIASSFEFVRCSLHHGFRSNVAADDMRQFLRRELYTRTIQKLDSRMGSQTRSTLNLVMPRLDSNN
jgi:hypothetical protein